MKKNPIRLLVVDDQEAYRIGLKALLSTVDDVSVVGEAADGRQAIEVSLRVKPDVVLMDLRMPGMDGIAATRQLIASMPHVKVLVLTTFDEDASVRAAVAAGASGYVLKDTPAEDMADLIRVTSKGYVSFGPGLVRKEPGIPSIVEDPIVLFSSLTARERDVLRELAAGATNRAIALALGLGEGTVRNHVTRILSQLGVTTRTEAALLAKSALRREQ